MENEAIKKKMHSGDLYLPGDEGLMEEQMGLPGSKMPNLPHLYVQVRHFGGFTRCVRRIASFSRLAD